MSNLVMRLFGRESMVSWQTWQYVTALPNADLHDYEVAFLEGQDVALTLSCQRATEREHAVLASMKRAKGRNADGATACARKRQKICCDELEQSRDSRMYNLAYPMIQRLLPCGLTH